MFKKMHDHKGFTLIELMIVVAIIGILAAIAIPNFLKYQAKSKQAEAKTNLKGIFTAEISYFGEMGFFIADFNDLGFGLAGDTAKSYDFAVDTTNGPWIGKGQGAVPAATSPTGGWAADDGKTYTPGAGTNTFTAAAIGNIDADADIDGWVINYANSIVCVNNDV